MASFSSITTLALAVLLFLNFAAVSSSRRALIQRRPPPPKAGFRATLHHVDSGKNLTKFERIQLGINRSFHRLQKLNAVVLAAVSGPGPDDIEAPIHGGNGEFLMNISIGTPPVGYSAIVDTGSDLIWTQCEPCSQCFHQPTPIFDPKKSSSYSKLGCSSDLCDALPQSDCKNNACEYMYTYGDYSSTQGTMATETFTFEDKNSISRIGFGCGDDNQGDGFTQGSGLVGLGRGPLSLVSQLKEKKFAYCLTSMEDNKAASSLFIGSLASDALNKTSDDSEMATTPLIRNPAQPSFYYLSLEGVTVGDKTLPFNESTFALNEDGTGGMIIDSGTTITYLEQSAFDALKKEFSSQVKLPVDDSGSTGLDLCYKLPSNAKQVTMPKLIFHFKGADLELPGENYMVGDSDSGALCLAMGGSSGMSILGNVQQQNFMVLHDLDKETVSFLPTECGNM